MRKSHVKRLGLKKSTASLTPQASSSTRIEVPVEEPVQKSQPKVSIDNSIRFSTCAQSTPKSLKVSMTDDEDPFADDEEIQNLSPNISLAKDKFKLPTAKPKPPASQRAPVAINIRHCKTYMDEVLETCKFFLESSSSGEHVIREYKTIFIRNIEKELKKENNDTKFLNAFKEYHSDNEKLQISFAPTKLLIEDSSDDQNQTEQDCLIRLMLQVKGIQSRLIVYLTERISAIILAEKENNEGMAWVRKYLNSLSYLDVIYDSSSLSEQLFDILSLVNNNQIKDEIITSLPAILNCDVHSSVGAKLTELLNSDDSLRPVILDTLSILTISSDTLRTVKEAALESLKTACLEELPAIVKFLIDSENSYDVIINGIRSNLSFDQRPLTSAMGYIPTQSDKETKKKRIAIQMKVFTCIRDEMYLNKLFFDAWLKNIKGIPTNKDATMQPIDLIILIIMFNKQYGQTDKHKDLVLKVLKSLILNGTVNKIVIGKTFKSFIHIIKDEYYFTPFMSIVTQLIRSVERTIVNTTVDIFCELLNYVDSRHIRKILNDITTIIGCGDNTSVQNALKILNKICIQYRNKIRPLSTFLLTCLNKLDDLSIYDVRHLLHAMCLLSSQQPGEQLSPIREDINISIIQKKLSSVDIQSLRIGVIGAVMMIKHEAIVPEQESNTLPSECSASNNYSFTLPITERAMEANKLMQNVNNKLKYKSNDALALFYDQLNFILFQDKNIDVTFKIKIVESIKEYLQANFFIKNYRPPELPDPDYLKCSVQFSLSQPPDKLSVNITELLWKVKTPRKTALLLPILMRLLRVADYIHNIDNLLDLGLILPLPQSFDVNGFVSLTTDQQEVVISSLFIAINWLRELINCFASCMKDHGHDSNETVELSRSRGTNEDEIKNKRHKVIVRLQNIVYLQTKLAQCLFLLSSECYSPPSCYFHVTVRNPVSNEKSKTIKPNQKGSKNVKNNKSRKRKRPTSSANTTSDVSRLSGVDSIVNVATQDVDDQDNMDVSVEEPKPETLQSDLSLYRSFFRELDTDVWLLFNVHLTLVPSPEKDGKFSGEMGPCELLFLLDDCVNKLERALPSTVKKIPFFKSSNDGEKTLGFENLDATGDVVVLHNYIQKLKRLCRATEKIIAYLNRSLVAFDNISDAPGLFIPETRPIKLCLSQLFKSMAIVFSWSGFTKHPGQQEVPYLLYVQNGLRTFVECGSADSEIQFNTSSDLKFLVEESIVYLTNFNEYISYFPAAVSYIRLLQAISNFSPDLENVKTKISDIAWKFLTRRWYDLTGVEEKGVLFCNDLEYLIMSHFENAQGSANHLDTIISNLVQDIDDLTEKDSCLNSIATVGRANLHVLIKCLCKGIENEIRSKCDSDAPAQEVLECWVKAFEHMKVIVVVLKDKEQHKVKANLIAFLKQSIEIFKIYLKQGLPLCRENFRSEAALVCKVFRTQQGSTRYIQNICHHSKRTQDLQLSKYLPTAKQIMENIVLQVKHIVAINDCSDAIAVATLKMRDAAGEEIIQDSIQDPDDDDDDEGNASDSSTRNSSHREDDSGSERSDGESNSNIVGSDNEEVSDTSSVV